MTSKKFVLSVILVTLCSVGAYFHEDTVRLLNPLHEAILKTKVIPEFTHQFVPLNRPIESLPYNYNCRRFKKPEIKTITSEPIYRWEDEDGKLHFSDQINRASGHVDTVNLDLNKKDYFDLYIHQQDDTPAQLKSDLETHLRKVYDIMSGLLPSNKVSKITVNLWTFNNDHDYQRFRKRHAPTASAKSLGFHTNQENIAASLDRDGEQQLLTTSLHEAVHVMNSGLFGRTERWLNEGLAEYFERIKVYGQAGEIQYSETSIQDINQSPKKFSFRQIANANIDDWQGKHRNLIYSYSWAWVYFLMSQDDTREALISYLSATAENPCDSLISTHYFDQRIPGGTVQLQNRFNQWLPLAQANQHF